MKSTLKPMKFGQIILTAFFAFAIIFTFDSCTKKIAFTNSSVVPAAEGHVKVTKDKNKNYSVSVDVVNLAQPDKLSPPKSVYVVWMDTESNGTKNIGQLTSSGSLLSKTLKGSLKTISSFKPTRVFVTAEDNGNVTFPGMVMVMQTEAF